MMTQRNVRIAGWLLAAVEEIATILALIFFKDDLDWRGVLYVLSILQNLILGITVIAWIAFEVGSALSAWFDSLPKR